MNKIRPFLLVLLVNINSLFSQEKELLLIGKVVDSLGSVQNVTVLNLNSIKGTSSDDEGMFEIPVRVGDTVRFSSIQHKTQKIYIDKKTSSLKRVPIFLTIQTTLLDEFELIKHDLSGFLGVDNKKTPKNPQALLLASTMDFSQINWNARTNDDYIDNRVRPPMVNTVPNLFSGVGVGISMPYKSSEKLWALRREIALKKAIPSKILAEFGEDFFFQKLQIPKENYHHFLEYCNPLGIEKLFAEGHNFEVLIILQEQSKSYLEIIKKD